MDYSGFVFGDIKVLKRADGDLERCRKSKREKGTTTDPIYTCECLLCGKIFDRNIYNVKKNKFQNCGCQNLQYDLRGKKFGKLTALEPLSLNKHKEMTWKCVCDCGNDYVATSYSLRNNYTIQCRECAMKQIGDTNRKYFLTHEHPTPPNKIVQSEKYPTITRRLRETYTNMKTRCYNPNSLSYYRYGGRGIVVCDEWKDNFVAFALWALDNGHREDLTIDRIDNNGNYEPNNCRFVSRTEQANNRGTSTKLEYNGEFDTMANWSRRLRMPYYYIQYRIYKGRSMEDIVNEFNNGARCKRKKIETQQH